MTTISNLEVLVQDRLEEQRGLPGVFWQVQDEIRPFLVEAMNEACLITGEPQVRYKVLFTLTANTRFFTLPAGLFAMLRLEGAGPVQKTSVVNLDRYLPGWEAVVAAPNTPVPSYWFPFGLGQFGIYPLLQQSVNVFLTGVQIPIITARPYTGAEPVPFNQEYLEGFTQFGAHVARVKEGGRDFMDSIKEYDSFLGKMLELSKWMDRKGVLRFSKSVGAKSQITDVQVK